MNSLVDEIIEQIQKAEQEAIKQGIETNAVVLNENFDKCRDFAPRKEKMYRRADKPLREWARAITIILEGAVKARHLFLPNERGH